MNNFSIPTGLGIALAANPEAMKRFSALTVRQKWEIVSGTHAIQSAKEMTQYVRNIAKLDIT